ncbi:hypothetical protein [Burkholderia ubonensis]|uniref:hypothetical protein n=1 Tax=Burkholderia ubonensis TaxID=101571 RepID=UPI001452F7A8|nr:hypothetical protein [Burkholderia ubonensis]VWC06375.1 hypothetical protein BUB20358_05099 [Burkholderia ubonensis]
MAGTTNQTVITLAGSPTGTTIPVAYNTMPGNQPAEYGNTLFIWQAGNAVPWNSPPEGKQSISSNSQDGSDTFRDLSVTTLSYIIGYAVGPDKTQVCASVFVPAVGGSDAAQIQKAIDIALAQGNQASVAVQAFPGATSVQVNYTTLDGYPPGANNNWVGIWERGTVPLSGADPIQKVSITSNSSTGSTGFSNIRLLRGHTYSVGYFMGPKQTMLAASYTFTV